RCIHEFFFVSEHNHLSLHSSSVYLLPMRPSSYATLLSVVAALGGLLFGYDTAVISGAIGFLRASFNLGPAETGFAASSALIGCVLGAAAAGPLSDRYGRKRALLLSALLFTISAVGSAIPRTLVEFNIARIVGGVGVGMASVLSPLYIAEISPPAIRGRLVSYNQFAIVIGILLVYFVNYYIAGLGSESWNTEVGWRWMFGSETLPAIMFFLALLGVPESPRWLVKRGEDQQAQAILSRLGTPEDARAEIAAIKETLTDKPESIATFLTPGIRRAVIIGIVLAILQQITGINVFMYYAPEIFKQLGAGTDTALLQTVLVGAFNVTFTVVAIWTVDRIGRKPLMMIGATGMGISLVGLGLAAYFASTQLWVLVFVLGYIACFAMSLGPVVWVILSEIYPTRIRGRAMAVATLLLWLANFAVSQTFPVINENPWLVGAFNHAFPFWLYAIFCAVTVIVTWRFVPETKEKTLEQIEQHWRTTK
ncbi:MAG: sugar transporter, partial [Bacteroidetes bacterium]|nr:sugar transporter [Bacteroidota bacterium]